MKSELDVEIDSSMPSTIHPSIYLFVRPCTMRKAISLGRCIRYADATSPPRRNTTQYGRKMGFAGDEGVCIYMKPGGEREMISEECPLLATYVSAPESDS